MAGDDAKVLIAGGGVGGLAAALALQRAGIRTTVLERAPAPTTGPKVGSARS